MKKVLLAAVIVLVALVALGVAGYAYAQTPAPPVPQYPYGQGMMGGRSMMGGRGMMGGWQGAGYGPMHTYMVEAWAEALDMDVEDLQPRLNEGATMWSIAQEKGLSPEEFYATMAEVHAEALGKAVDAGVITQEQADWMQSHMGGRGGAGFGPCHGGGFGPGRGPGRWNTQPQQPAG
jgi:hypothetical protein